VLAVDMDACDDTVCERVVVAVEMRAGGVDKDIHVGHASTNQISAEYSINPL
jgi:hypothetical protein